MPNTVFRNIALAALPALLLAGQAQAGRMTCESGDYKYHYCPANTGGAVRLVQVLSQSNCTQGNSWGFDRNGIWVDHGCRAAFDYGTENQTVPPSGGSFGNQQAPNPFSQPGPSSGSGSFGGQRGSNPFAPQGGGSTPFGGQAPKPATSNPFNAAPSSPANASSIPQWALGHFRGHFGPLSADGATLVIDGNGQAMVYGGNGNDWLGKAQGNTIRWMTGTVSVLAPAGDGIAVTTQGTNQTDFFRRI